MPETNNQNLINESILKKRWKKFKTLKRGYYSLVALTVLYGISFLLPVLINNRALIVKYNGSYYYPVFSGYIAGEEFGQDVPGEAKYRQLKNEFGLEKNIGNWVWMPPYPYSPFEDITTEGNKMYELSLIHI